MVSKGCVLQVYVRSLAGPTRPAPRLSENQIGVVQHKYPIALLHRVVSLPNLVGGATSAAHVKASRKLKK